MKKIRNPLAETVRQKRREAKLSRRELASRAGVAPEFVRRLEAGDTALRLDRAQRVLSEFGDTLVPLSGDGENPSGGRFAELFRLLLPPPLYAPGPEPFWDDEYISGRMLEAHLDPGSDGASRNHEFIRRSAEWIAALTEAPEGKKLLDLGCGPGLYTGIFREKGFSVWGLDLSRRSIDYAERNTAPDIVYQCGNYLTLPFPEEVDLATMIYCDFGVLPPEDRKSLLRKVHAALAEGGMFVFDVFTPDQYAETTENESVEYAAHGGFWSPSPYFCITQRRSYEEYTTFLRQIAVLTEESCRAYHIWEHVFTPDELRTELEEAGFSAVRFHGDVAGATWTGRGKTLAAVAVK